MKQILLCAQLLFVTQITCFSQAISHSTSVIDGNSQSIFKERSLNKVPFTATKSWEASAGKYISASEYFFQNFGEQYVAANRKQKLCFTTSGTLLTSRVMQLGSTTKDKPWSSSLELVQIGQRDLSAAVSRSAGIISNKEHLLFQYEGFQIEYLNGEDGLRQNFIVNSRPGGNEKLSLFLNITGDLSAAVSNNNVLELADQQTGKTVLKYDGLAVWDANKVPLKACMQLKDKRLQFIVDDANATYPITIDPLSHTPEWQASADAVLPGLLNNFQLQVNALLGYSVAGLGDVNGDGYDDVAIGAPGAIDIIAGPTTIVGAGAVFVYFGSATGLSAVPDKILRATTPVTNALFGFSIAGGNVTGDSKNDIVIGAPGDTYSTTVSGFPSTATVTAGKVYVFRGEDLAAAGNPSPLLSVFMDGPGFFSHGILGVLAANINENALFGFSVAVSDDLNGDGLGEVIVGSPGYAAPQLVLEKSGAAFVYYSGNLASNTATQLTAPSSGLLGVADLDGLLFGFSVDGCGDYNKDGKPDIVVGAPAGVSILTNFLGGSAYVYNGNGAGVNTTFGTQLIAGGGGLLGTVANLFGYSVRGVRNASGIRTGNILAGAPSGNILSNVLGGLQLKSGSIHVFIANASPGTTTASDQNFSSPRDGSLLGILAGQNLNVNVLFASSIDNMLDVDCDGNADIIVGEPLSTGVGLISANVVGGAAYVFLGNADGTYNVAPYWTLENQVSVDLGINATSLLGYSVAGSGHIAGPNKAVRALIGAPGQAIDFSSGVFNLTNTFGTLYSFSSVNDNLGKAYTSAFTNCSLLGLTLTDLAASVTDCNVSLKWKIPVQTDLGHIEVEQSSNGAIFNVIQKIDPGVTENYVTKVPQVNAIAYYRLKLIDKDGKFTYSQIVTAKTSCGIPEKIELYPNPVITTSTILFSTTETKGKADLIVRDVYGRMLLNSNVNITSGTNRVYLNISSLPAGVYYVSIGGKDWNSEALKVIKEK